jgi:hypothetical protein
MKYLNMILAAVLVSIVAVQAAQDTALTQREVRDPRKLEVWLEGNASDAETRIAAVEAVAGAPDVAGSADTLTNTVTITANDLDGDTLAQRRLVRVWVAETAYGAPSTNNIESLTLSGGTAIQTVTAAADYIYLTAATGIASAEVVGTAAGTNYVMVADGGYVTSEAVVFTAE